MTRIRTLPHIRFNVDEYFRMSEAEVFGERRVELLNGQIIEMHRQTRAHIASVSRITMILARYFDDFARYWPIFRGTLIIRPWDAPDPDFHVFDVRIGTPDGQLPLPFVVIEVADKSYRRDAGIKLRRYASAGIKDYWIVNIPEKRVEVYRYPENPTGRKRDWRYKTVRHFSINAKVKMLAYPKVELAVRDMLP
jgi:Uma2 family endonuclease